MWDNIIATHYQKEEVETIINNYIEKQKLKNDEIVIKINDIVDNKVYLRLSQSCVSNKTTIEQHFENLQKELLQEAPWVSGISATLLTAFHYLTMESNKKDV